MLPNNQSLNKSEADIGLTNLSPRGFSFDDQQNQSQKPYSQRLEQSLTSGQLMTSLSGGFIALGMKELKDELRLTKKSEQMVKEKLQDTKKQLEVELDAHAKYRQDAEARIDTIKTENRMLQLSLKHMHEQNEAMERSSTQSNNTDAFRIVEEYSKQNEHKSREIEELLIVAANKKTKHQQLKKLNADLELRLNRLQSKLDNMSKFCRIFIKSTKLQNQSLRDTVEQQHKDFSLVFTNCKQDIYDHIQGKFTQTRINFETLLAAEREHVSNLKDQLDKSDNQHAEKIRQTAANTQSQLQKELETLISKNTKLRQKLATIKVTQSDADEQQSTHQVDVLNLQIQNQKQKYDLQLSEKDNYIQSLRETIQSLQTREGSLSQKLETVDAKSRQEYQRLVEMYEGSQRFKEIRELYEGKITSRDQQILQAREELVKCQVRLEVANQGIDTFKVKEQKLKQKANDAENSLQEVRKSSQDAQQALMSELAQLRTDQQTQMQSFVMNSAKEFEEEIQKSKLQIETQSNNIINDLKTQLLSGQQKQSDLFAKIDEIKFTLTVKNTELQTINSLLSEAEVKRLEEVEQEKTQYLILIEQLQKQNLGQSGKIAELLTKEQTLNLEIKELQKQMKEESMASNWQLEDFRTKITTLENNSNFQSQSTAEAKIVAHKDTQTLKLETNEVSIEAIIINSSMAESHHQKQGEAESIERSISPENSFKSPASTVTAFVVPQPKPSQKPVNTTRQVPHSQETTHKSDDRFVQTKTQEPSIEPTAVTFSSIQSQTQVEENKAIDAKQITKVNQTPQTEEAQPSRFYAIISSFMGILSKRKQAFTGKPASAMYYCKEKNRWIINGEDDSEDDAPPTPPPKAKPAPSDLINQLVQKVETKLQNNNTDAAVGLKSLTQPVFGGALANRNRAARKPNLPKALPTSTFPAQIIQVAETRKEEEVLEVTREEITPTEISHMLNETTELLNVTTFTARDYLSESVVIETQHLREIEIHLREIDTIRVREAELERVCTAQGDKITSFRSQIQNLQDALKNEKKMSQQTIVELESFSNEMQEAGAHLQKQLNEVTEALNHSKSQIATLEATNWLAEDNFCTTEQELSIAKQELRNLKQKYLTLELQQQISQIQRQMIQDEQIIQASTVTQQAYDNLEDKCENLKWQVTVAQQNYIRIEEQSGQQKRENTRLLHLVEQYKTDQRDFSMRVKDLQDRNDRDREMSKESQINFLKEREVLQESIKKITGEMQLMVRRNESEKQQQQQEFLKLAQNKDFAYQQKLEAFETKKNEEIQAIQSQLQAQTNQVQSQARHEQGRIKKQINSLESVLVKKDEDLQLFIGRNEEAQQEIQSMSEMRQKLNDHIVYLQNEIRKRDDLLEDGSDFNSDSEQAADDNSCSYSVGVGGHNTSSSQLGQQQRQTPSKRSIPKPMKQSKHLDEARNQIKTLMNQKVELAKDVSNLNQQLRNSVAALEQLFYLLDVDQEDKATNEVVQLAIAKFFKIKNDYESKQMELQHLIQQLEMQVDNTENLNFEINLLTSERDLLHTDFTDLNQHAHQLQNSLEEATKNYETQLNLQQNEFRQSQEMLKRQISSQEQSQEKLKEELQGQISGLRLKIAQKDDLIGQLGAHKKSIQVDQEQYLIQNQDLQTKLSAANKLREQNTNRFEVHIEELQNANNEAEQQLQNIKLQRAGLIKQIDDLEESLQEKVQLLQQSEQRIDTLNQEFENLAKAFVQKKENYKQTIQKLRVSSAQNDSHEVTELKAQLAQADNLIQEMQSETEQIVKRMQEKKLQREQKLKDKISELLQNVQDLSAEIEQCRSQMTKRDSESSQHISAELTESKILISELTSQNSAFKQAYQQLQDKHQDEISTIHSTNTLLQQQLEGNKQLLNQAQINLSQLKTQIENKTNQDNQTSADRLDTLLKNKNSEIESEINRLKETILVGEDRLKTVEAHYQSESQKLAELFKQKQQQQRDKTQQLKQEMRNLITSCQDLETKVGQSNQEVEVLRSQLKHLQEEKLNLSQSLDLTKIEANKEISQIQADRKLFESELEQQLSRFNQMAIQIINLLDPDIVIVDLTQQAQELLQERLKNADEDKLQIQRLVSEKDEMQEEVDGLMYKIQNLVQERDRMQYQLTLTEKSDLAKMVKTLEEERSELRNDFVIKMDSMSQEMSILQDKIQIYEGKTGTSGQQLMSQQVSAKSQDNSTNYKLDADQQRKTTPVKNTSFLASLFLTNSDISK